MLCRKFLFDINSEIPKLQDHSSNLKMSVANRNKKCCIKRKLPGTVFQCYHFVPQYGELQCLWYLQWMLCRKFLFDINSEIPKLQDHSSNLKMSVANRNKKCCIKRKLPGTVFQCYHFVPQYGELQCLWYHHVDVMQKVSL